MRLPLASVGQAGTASGAATGQDLAAVTGRHTLAEPVLLGALTLLGLIGTNHTDTPPVSFSGGRTLAHHNGRIAPAAVDNNRRFHGYPRGYAKDIIAEKKSPCQPKFFAPPPPVPVILPSSARYCAPFGERSQVPGKIFCTEDPISGEKLTL